MDTREKLHGHTHFSAAHANAETLVFLQVAQRACLSAMKSIITRVSEGWSVSALTALHGWALSERFSLKRQSLKGVTHRQPCGDLPEGFQRGLWPPSLSSLGSKAFPAWRRHPLGTGAWEGVAG